MPSQQPWTGSPQLKSGTPASISLLIPAFPPLIGFEVGSVSISLGITNGSAPGSKGMRLVP